MPIDWMLMLCIGSLVFGYMLPPSLIWDGGPEYLRQLQLLSGIAALDLMNRIIANNN